VQQEHRVLLVLKELKEPLGLKVQQEHRVLLVLKELKVQ
jgi:hypothetical protein